MLITYFLLGLTCTGSISIWLSLLFLLKDLEFRELECDPSPPTPLASPCPGIKKQFNMTGLKLKLVTLPASRRPTPQLRSIWLELSPESFWIDSKMLLSSGVALIWFRNSWSWGCLSAPEMVIRAATALIADLLSSSCFSYSCLTELALTLVVQVSFRGSTSLSSFWRTAPGHSWLTLQHN